MTTGKSKFNWENLIIGIIFIITSLIAFRDPTANLLAIVMVFGISALFDGVFQLFIRRRIRKVTGYRSTFITVIGVINLLIGILLLFNLYGSAAALPYVFSFWFIIRSIEGLLNSGLAKIVSNGYYWFKVIVNILGIIVGILLLKNPFSAVLTITYLVGFYFMLFGILNIIEAFAETRY
ncbi:HdeD family acid-resistance protein [Miniphocaeibacter halophilus]|uniref:DUF308 domain-containing protein n=1 Tax=Miniphocaeibacter halophilus TaxID=2931922 RepID=A0AC61MSE6_9FIRM|nr:DUF308 domain-containing protein [Miniphocaeibacter halophilus]QQK07136.1 DUF308 domain-containing protein [Miniphocaeibacter halophilus]